jgi:hypothetical protein
MTYCDGCQVFYRKEEGGRKGERYVRLGGEVIGYGIENGGKWGRRSRYEWDRDKGGETD